MCHFIPPSSLSQNLVEEMKQTSHKCLCNPKLIYNYKQSLQAHTTSLSIYVSEEFDIKNVISPSVFQFYCMVLSFYLLIPTLSLGFRVPTRFGGKVSANAIWSLMGRQRALIFFPWSFFFGQKVSITLQRIQMSSILCQVIVVSLTISRLSRFQNTSPITTVDLLQVIDF